MIFNPLWHQQSTGRSSHRRAGVHIRTCLVNPGQPTAVAWPLSERPLLLLTLFCRHWAGGASLLRAEQSRKPQLQSSWKQHHGSHGVNECSGLLSCLRRERQRIRQNGKHLCQQKLAPEELTSSHQFSSTLCMNVFNQFLATIWWNIANWNSDF